MKCDYCFRILGKDVYSVQGKEKLLWLCDDCRKEHELAIKEGREPKRMPTFEELYGPQSKIGMGFGK